MYHRHHDLTNALVRWKSVSVSQRARQRSVLMMVNYRSRLQHRQQRAAVDRAWRCWKSMVSFRFRSELVGTWERCRGRQRCSAAEIVLRLRHRLVSQALHLRLRRCLSVWKAVAVQYGRRLSALRAVVMRRLIGHGYWLLWLSIRKWMQHTAVLRRAEGIGRRAVIVLRSKALMRILQRCWTCWRNYLRSAAASRVCLRKMTSLAMDRLRALMHELVLAPTPQTMVTKTTTMTIINSDHRPLDDTRPTVLMHRLFPPHDAADSSSQAHAHAQVHSIHDRDYDHGQRSLIMRCAKRRQWLASVDHYDPLLTSGLLITKPTPLLVRIAVPVLWKSEVIAVLEMRSRKTSLSSSSKRLLHDGVVALDQQHMTEIHNAEADAHADADAALHSMMAGLMSACELLGLTSCQSREVLDLSVQLIAETIRLRTEYQRAAEAKQREDERDDKLMMTLKELGNRDAALAAESRLSAELSSELKSAIDSAKLAHDKQQLAEQVKLSQCSAMRIASQ